MKHLIVIFILLWLRLKWLIDYPNYNNVKIALVGYSKIQENDEHNREESYIKEVNLYREPTYRGLIAGDAVEKVYELYGEPDAVIMSAENGMVEEMHYISGNQGIRVRLDKAASTVKFIEIDFDVNNIMLNR